MKKKLLKRLLPSFLRKIITFYLYRPIKNRFKTDFSKTVLISLITTPFRKRQISYSHTNFIEALEIAKVFKFLKYNVDIYNYNDERNINYDKYDVIFGFGEPLCSSFYNRKNKICTIYYGTGMHVCVQNHNTLNRVKEIYNKRNIWLLSSTRIVEKAWSIQTTLVDAMILLGNETVEKSYKKYYDGHIYNIPVTFYNVIDVEEVEKIIKNKNYNEAKYNFLWFGGSGLVHKGLDLVLEIFEKNPKWQLHICGPIHNERKFEEIYYKQLYELQNIYTYNFIDLKSNLFKDLMFKCLFTVFPSCSEGEPSSVINIMANGLIPIISKESGIRIKDFGYAINKINTQAIEKAINNAISEDNEILKQKSMQCFNDTRKNHSLSKFRKELKNTLEEKLDEYNGGE